MSPLRADARTRRSAPGALGVALCLLVAALEGFDIQAVGVAAPAIARDLHLGKAALGQALAASNIGLVLGASVGGWLADRLGRKPVLIAATLAFGAFTLATAGAHAYAILFAARLGAGIGFGAALANLMAASVEMSRAETRGAVGALMFCGMPVGGGIVAAMAWLTPHLDWRTLFLVGGLAPVALAPALVAWLRETHAMRTASPWTLPAWMIGGAIALYLVAFAALALIARRLGADDLNSFAPWLAVAPAAVALYALVHRSALFAAGRAPVSALIWIVFAPTLLVLYLILNWLPTLVAAKGFPADAAQASVWFNFAGVAGALALGPLVDRFGVRWTLSSAFAALIVVLFALAHATALGLILGLSGAAGFLLLGANFAFYGAAASRYPQEVRGRGAGAAIAWGRLGSVFGPLVGGYLLARGADAGAVVLAMAPFAACAGAATVALGFMPEEA